MKVKNLITIVDALRSVSLSLEDEKMDWASWSRSKPTTIHNIADDKFAKFDSMKNKVSNILELIKEVDL